MLGYLNLIFVALTTLQLSDLFETCHCGISFPKLGLKDKFFPDLKFLLKTVTSSLNLDYQTDFFPILQVYWMPYLHTIVPP